LLLFIQGVNAKLKATEELASMNSFHGNYGEDIFKDIKKAPI
jgi:hypothetical protein